MSLMAASTGCNSACSQKFWATRFTACAKHGLCFILPIRFAIAFLIFAPLSVIAPIFLSRSYHSSHQEFFLALLPNNHQYDCLITPLEQPCERRNFQSITQCSVAPKNLLVFILSVHTSVVKRKTFNTP
jgi:hypothetical protein